MFAAPAAPPTKCSRPGSLARVVRAEGHGAFAKHPGDHLLVGANQGRPPTHSGFGYLILVFQINLDTRGVLTVKDQAGQPEKIVIKLAGKGYGNGNGNGRIVGDRQ